LIGGFNWVDPKDCIFGKNIAGLADAENRQLDELLEQRRLKACCLSSGIFGEDVEEGEAFFRRQFDDLENLLKTARVLNPRFIRLLAPQTRNRKELSDSIKYIHLHHPWLMDVFREAIDRINAAGFAPIIENECGSCIFSNPAEVLGFFDTLDRGGRVSFTWDVQNLWQMGSFPSLETYIQFNPILGLLHVKGGQFQEGSRALVFSSTLQDASWPVADIVQRVVEDGTSPFICLNSSHGTRKPGYDYDDVIARDLAFLRTLKGINQ